MSPARLLVIAHAGAPPGDWAAASEPPALFGDRGALGRPGVFACAGSFAAGSVFGGRGAWPSCAARRHGWDG